MLLAVDAHALLWWLGDDPRLSSAAKDAIATAERPLIGAGTLIEIAVKKSLGKLELDDDWLERTEDDGFQVLDVSLAHTRRLQQLPFISVAGKSHRDPFDRLLVAQAQVERIPVISRDPMVAAYGVAVIW